MGNFTIHIYKIFLFNSILFLTDQNSMHKRYKKILFRIISLHKGRVEDVTDAFRVHIQCKEICNLSLCFKQMYLYFKCNLNPYII